MPRAAGSAHRARRFAGLSSRCAWCVELDDLRVVVPREERVGVPALRVDRERHELVRVGDVHRPVAECQLVLALLDLRERGARVDLTELHVDLERLQRLLDDLGDLASRPAPPAPTSISTVKPFLNFDLAISAFAFAGLYWIPGDFGS